jgi:hypothetical protein
MNGESYLLKHSKKKKRKINSKKKELCLLAFGKLLRSLHTGPTGSTATKFMI